MNKKVMCSMALDGGGGWEKEGTAGKLIFSCSGSIMVASSYAYTS